MSRKESPITLLGHADPRAVADSMDRGNREEEKRIYVYINIIVTFIKPLNWGYSHK